MKRQKVYIIIILMLMMGMTSCASYLYTAYVPIAAYDVAEGIIGRDNDIRYADAGSVLEKLNTEMANDGSAVTLADTYKSAYGKGFKDLPADGDTGQAFADMRTATRYFRDILRAKRITNADDFVLTRIDGNQPEDFALIAVVYRPGRVIDVQDDKKPNIRKVLTPESPDYYRPYQTDGRGRSLDVVAQWAAVPVDCFEKQGQQALFLTATANDVIEKKTAGNFWQAVEKWENGDIESVVVAQNYLTCPSLDIARG